MADSPNISGDGVLRLTVYSEGKALDESIQVVSIEVSSRINAIPMARVVVLDGDMPEKKFPLSDSASFKPGAAIKIDAGYDEEEDTIFEGVVIRHGVKITGENYSRLIVECRDKAIGMTVGRKNANYVDQKDSDIITKLIKNGKLKADVEATKTKFKELVQYYCSDWDYLLSRAEVNGLLVIVKDGKVSVKAPQVKAAAKLEVTYGEDLLEFHADVDAVSQLAAVKGVGWDLKTQKVVEGEGSLPKLNEQGDLKSKDLAKVVGLDSFRLQTAAPLEKAALKGWADAQWIKSGLAKIRGRMKFQGSAKAALGELIELKGVGNRFNGDVFVSAVRHDIESGNWTTEVEFGMSPDWFADRRDLVTPPAAGWLPGVEGLQIGVVKKLDGDPEKEQKIQVTLPVSQAKTEGVWARIAKFYGSDGIGSFFVPEVGDEVILGYVNNDPCHPVILGSLYSSKRKPPYELTADNFIKALVTRSKLKLEFDDEKKVVTIITPAKNKIVISDDEKSLLLQDQNNNKVKLSPGGIDMSSPKDIKISAKGKIAIDAVGEIGVTSKVDVKVGGLNIKNDAKVGFTAKGSATAELSAAGQTTVKGAMVMIN